MRKVQRPPFGKVLLNASKFSSMRIGNGRHYENKTSPVSLVQIEWHCHIHFLLFTTPIKKKEVKGGEPDYREHTP